MKLQSPRYLATAMVLLLCGCGGGSDSSGGATTITGSVVKGPVSASTVTVRDVATGSVIGTTNTMNDGSYGVTIVHSGDVVVEAAGGDYIDEANGAASKLKGPMRVVLNAKGGNVIGMVTPLTTMAYTQAFGKGAAVSAAAFNAMAANVADQFKLGSVNLVTTLPVVSGTTNSYGDVLRALSYYAFRGGNTAYWGTSLEVERVVGTPLTAKQLPDFSVALSASHSLINPDKPAVTYTFDSTALNASAADSNAGSCAVSYAIISTVKSERYVCFAGVPPVSCNSQNAALNAKAESIIGKPLMPFIPYAYADYCRPGAMPVSLQ